MAENLRFKGNVTGAPVTKTADWWVASIAVEVPDEIADKKATAVSIDVGLNRLVHGGGNASVVQ
jgi:putative transposase